MDYILSTINYVLNTEANDFEEYVCSRWGIEFSISNERLFDRAIQSSDIDHIYKDAYLAKEEVEAKKPVYIKLNNSQLEALSQ